MFNKIPFLILGAAILMTPLASEAVTITFNNAINSATSYDYDADGDALVDAVFSTTDPDGFNTMGPPPQNYVSAPGLEGTTELTTDLRVDFNYGLSGSLSFGYAYSEYTDGYTVTALIYDASDHLLATGTSSGVTYTTETGPNGIASVFPEGLLEVSFTGTATYVLIDFDIVDTHGRYLLDNFTGTFGSVELGITEVPESSTTAGLFGVGGLFSLLVFRKRRK